MRIIELQSEYLSISDSMIDECRDFFHRRIFIQLFIPIDDRCCQELCHGQRFHCALRRVTLISNWRHFFYLLVGLFSAGKPAVELLLLSFEPDTMSVEVKLIPLDEKESQLRDLKSNSHRFLHRLNTNDGATLRPSLNLDPGSDFLLFLLF